MENFRRLASGWSESVTTSAERDGLAGRAREIAELYLYSGDVDQPLNDGYSELLSLADSIETVVVGSPSGEAVEKPITVKRYCSGCGGEVTEPSPDHAPAAVLGRVSGPMDRCRCLADDGALSTGPAGSPEHPDKREAIAREAVVDHDFLPVNGHPDDDECTHRADGTDVTYCGLPREAHEHLPGGSPVHEGEDGNDA